MPGLPKFEALNFPGNRLWQISQKFDGARLFVRCQLLLELSWAMRSRLLSPTLFPHQSDVYSARALQA